MRILLTGSTGFLGSALAHHWVSRGHQLCVLVRPSSNLQRIKAILGSVELAHSPTAETAMAVVDAFAPDAIVHTACAYGRQGESSLQILDANVRLGAALLEASIQRQSGQTAFLNTGTVLTPEVSLYALSKTHFSQWGKALATQYGSRIQFIDIKLQQMYGAGDDRSKFTTHVIEACRMNEPSLALSPGEQRRDFIYIDDVVSAFDTILTRRDALGHCESIEVGSGNALRMRDFVELVHRLTGANTELKFGAVPYRPAEDMLCVADISRLRALGWAPKFDLETGLARMLAQHAPIL